MVAFYGFETWSLALKEENRLKVLQNRVVLNIFRPMRDEVTGGRRRLHNEEFHSVITRIIKSRRTRWAGNVKRIEGKGMHRGSCWRNQREGVHLGTPRHA